MEVCAYFVEFIDCPGIFVLEFTGGFEKEIRKNKPAGDDGPILPPFYSTKARTENFLSPEKFL